MANSSVCTAVFLPNSTLFRISTKFVSNSNKDDPLTLISTGQIDRFQEPGSFGLLCDLLWADPVPNFGHETEPSQHPSPVPPGQLWGHNTTRGCSYYFTSGPCFFPPISPNRFVQV